MLPLSPLAPYAAAMKLAAAVSLVVLVALMGWRVSAWHDAYRSLQATEKALERTRAELDICTSDAAVAEQAYTDAAEQAETIAAEQRAAAQRVEHELQSRLAAADAGARDLARRLRDYQTRPSRCPVPSGSGAAGELAGAAGEPADGQGVDAAAEAHFVACARDAERLAGWQQWWAKVGALGGQAKGHD